MIGAENNLLEMGTVEVRINHVRSRPGIREWAIVMPETKPNHHLLDMYRRELELPEPMNIGMNVTAWQGLLEYVSGPVMLVGPVALGLWRGDLIDAKCAWSLDGKTCVWWDTHVVLTCRELAPPKGVPPMNTLAWLLQTPVTATNHLSTRCVQCGNEWAHWDRDGVPYCATCWPKEMGKWETARDAKATAMAKAQPDSAF